MSERLLESALHPRSGVGRRAGWARGKGRAACPVGRLAYQGPPVAAGTSAGGVVGRGRALALWRALSCSGGIYRGGRGIMTAGGITDNRPGYFRPVYTVRITQACRPAA